MQWKNRRHHSHIRCEQKISKQPFHYLNRKNVAQCIRAAKWIVVDAIAYTSKWNRTQPVHMVHMVQLRLRADNFRHAAISIIWRKSVIKDIRI